MAKSKRNKKVTLSQTEKKGLKLKQKLIEVLQSCLDMYQRVFIIKVHNMRNIHLKDVREQWKGSRFFFGKNKVMAISLGKNPETEYCPGLHSLVAQLRGPLGLLFTNCNSQQVHSFFKQYRKPEFARSGDVATCMVTIEKGPVGLGHSHTIEPELRRLKLPSFLNKGVVCLSQDHLVCNKGDRLTPEQGQVLKLFGHTMGVFRCSVVGYWNKDTGRYHSVRPCMKGRTKARKSHAMDAKGMLDVEMLEEASN